MNREFYGNLFEILNKYGEMYLITVVNSVDNNKIIGEKIIKYNDDILIGNKKLRDFWQLALKEVNLNKKSGVFKLQSGNELFIEYIVGKPNLVILGGGHVSLSLSNMAKLLNYNITVIDEREEFANKDRFFMVDNIICKSFSDAIDEVKFVNNTYAVIITRGHKEDKQCLDLILNKDIKYIGMMGSKKKIKTIFDDLLREGYDKELIHKIKTPIGLDIGAETPSEIAVSIIAEMVKIKNQESTGDFDELILKSINNSKNNMMLATIVEKMGSSPRGVGAKMLIHESGELIGSIGGGRIENIVYNRALELIKKEKSKIEFYDLTNSKNSNTNMICGGNIKILYEFISGN